MDDVSYKLIVQDPEMLVKEVLMNLPEYAQSFDVLFRDYEGIRYKLRDIETGQHYEVTKAELVVGLRLMISQLATNKLPGLSVNLSNVIDPCQWDVGAVDALLQLACLGEVVYG